MPRQPNPDQIAETALRPSMRAATISPGVSNEIGAGGRAIGAAISDVGNAFSQIAARSAETSDKQNDARFGLEWSKAQQDLYNQTKQNAGEDGRGWEGYAPKLRERYEELNKKYPISGDDRRLKREIGVGHDVLKRGQQALNTRLGMARKYHQGIEEKEIAGVVQRIQADPTDGNFNDLEAKARQLVESGLGTYYTKSDVEKRTRDVVGTLTMARYQSLLKKDPEAAKDLLEEVSKGRYKLDLKKAGGASDFKIIDGRVPTSSERRQIFRNGGVVVNLDTNWSKGGSQTSPMVVIPDNATPEQRAAAEAYAAKVADVYKRQFGKSLAPRVVTRSENGRGRPATIHTEPFAVTDARAVKYFTQGAGKAEHASILRETLGKIPGVQFSIPHDPGKGDKGAHGNGGNEVQFARALIEELKGKAVDGEIVPPQPKEAVRGEPARPGGPDLAGLVPQEAMQALRGIASDTPNAKLSEALSDDQMKGLKSAGIDVSKMTVSQALEMVARGAVESGGQDLNIAQEAAPKDQTLEELPAGQLEAGQVFTANSRQFGALTFAAESLNAIPRKLLAGLRKQATELARIRVREQQVIADDLMERQLETVSQTGKSHTEWSADVVRDAYRKNPKKIAAFNKRLSVAKEVHEVVGNADNLPNESLEERINDLETKALNSEGNADPQISKAYKTAQSRVKHILNMRRTDPAKAVNKTEEVREAVAQIPDGQVKTKNDVYRLVDARMRAQVRLGLPKTPISKQEANDLISPVAAAPEAEKMEAAKELARKVYKVYGDHAPLVLEAATRLSSLDRTEDRDMISAGKFYAERDAKAGARTKPADSNNDVEQAINGKMQGRVSSAKPRNPFDQFE